VSDIQITEKLSDCSKGRPRAFSTNAIMIQTAATKAAMAEAKVAD
jgi:hypothetical protein